jgi:hypothetical protein
MAFDPENHEIDPRSGFMVHKDTGHPIGLVPPPLHSPKDIEWPKWVKVHESHVLRKEVSGAPPHVSVPLFPEFHVNRESGEVTVLVHDEDQEKKALEAKPSDEPQLPLTVEGGAVTGNEGHDADTRAPLSVENAAANSTDQT